MTLSPVVYGMVRDGALVADDPELFKMAFRCHEGRRVRVEVTRERKARSLNQNRYYWAVIVHLIAAAMGEDDPEVAHDALKLQCNSEIRLMGKGAERWEMRVPLSTADLDTAGFEAYCDRCRRFAAEFFNLYIPLPHEVAV